MVGVGWLVGPVRHSGTFVKDTSNDKGDAIDVRAREGTGKTKVKHLRAEGRVPGILFRSGDTQGELLSMPSTDIERLVRRHGHTGVGSRILTLNFEGGDRKQSVVAKQIMQDAVTRAVENVTFMPCEPDTVVKVNVPVRTEGEDSCPGVKRGGFAWKLQKRLTVVCMAKDIPPDFTIDVSKMEIGDRFFLQDLDVPQGVEVKTKDDRLPIIKIAGKGR